jgi:serine/threonine protein kinase/Tol biopolymer transport system component
MNTDQWNRLSDWHNAWLDADAEGRLRLRAQLAVTQPDLVTPADALLADSSSLHDFLETPAFLLAARRMAQETASLSPGAEVGPYRVVSLIAHGGMGVVYRATDVRLHRNVALKMLAPIGVPDEPRVERFLREARVTASVDHPNVVKVYDVGVFEGHPYIVIELLEGETLRARLGRGRLTPSEARGIATDMARGLVAAHAAGLVHRDLKPENVFLTRAGVTKILDFGIAKLAPGAGRPRGAAPTVTGILLGTAGYLAPEQIRGEEVDARADLFALGSILFELVTGQRAFAGESTVDTLHAILHAPPPDLIGQRNDVPDALAKIVSRLLEKAPADRFQSAADLSWALEHTGTLSAAPPSGPARGVDRSTLMPRWAWVVAPMAVVVVALAIWLTTGSSPVHSQPGALTRFMWTLPEGTTLFSAPAVSPDGRRICWTGLGESAARQVFVRDMSSLQAAAVRGTEGGLDPFWAPDSRAIGFFADGKLKRVAVDGGPAIVLADAPESRGGTWSQSGVIVFAPNYRDTPLMRVSDHGGRVEPVTELDRGQEDVTNRWPAFLPDGIHFLYSVVSLRDDRRGIYVGSLEGPPARSTRRLFASESGAMYAPLGDGRSGVVLSVGNGRIEARPFDPVRRVLEGDARTIGIGAIGTSTQHAALLSASASVLAYSGMRIPWGIRFASIGRDGADLQFLSERELAGFPRISPDGGRLARVVVDPLRSNPDIWVHDLQRGTRLRLTTSGDFDVVPVWAPDGREVAFRSGTFNEPTLGFAAADGTGVTRTLACPQLPCEPSDWSPDGSYLIVTVRGRDIWTVPLEPGARPQPLLAEAFTERDARISPDGRWLAYVSDESGRPEVSVRSLVGPARRFVVSSRGGDQPVWRHDGSELFFAVAEGRLQSVSVRSDAQQGLVFGVATKLNVPPLGERHWGTTYDVSADGRRVYFRLSNDDRPPREFGVVMNWSALLK